MIRCCVSGALVMYSRGRVQTYGSTTKWTSTPLHVSYTYCTHVMCATGTSRRGLYTHTLWSRAPGGGGVRCGGSAARRLLLAALSLAVALRPAAARFVALGLVAALAAAFVAAVYFFFVYMRVFSCFVLLLCFTDFTSEFWPATPRGDFHEIA